MNHFALEVSKTIKTVFSQFQPKKLRLIDKMGNEFLVHKKNIFEKKMLPRHTKDAELWRGNIFI